ncbi:hypothetical protein ISCGN_032952 [Ixodes scapularis]
MSQLRKHSGKWFVATKRRAVSWSSKRNSKAYAAVRVNGTSAGGQITPHSALASRLLIQSSAYRPTHCLQTSPRLPTRRGHCARAETRFGLGESAAHAQCRQQRHHSGVTSES